MSEYPDLRSEFLDEEYAHSYMAETLNTQIATQIKVLREQREWSQKELADRAGMKQPVISMVENINYGSWSINTLRRLARAFDLRLKVSFETFSSGIDEIERFNRSSLQRTKRIEDLSIKGGSGKVTRIDNWKKPEKLPSYNDAYTHKSQDESYKTKGAIGRPEDLNRPANNQLVGGIQK